MVPARPWWQPLGANLREVSLFVEVDLAVLQHMESNCKALSSMQVEPECLTPVELGGVGVACCSVYIPI